MKNFTLTGNLGSDPKFYEGKGDNADRIHMRIAADKPFDRETGKPREDVPTEWFDVVAFGAVARNANASLASGNHVIVTGSLSIRQRPFYVEVKDSDELEEKDIDMISLRATSIAPTLTWQTTDIERVRKSEGRSGGSASGERKVRSKAASKPAAKPKAKAASAASVSDDEF